MNYTPKVSVIIPVYGVEEYIERCVRSLFEQTLEDIEYIFINDCTKDHSIEILQKLISDYPKRKEQVRLISNEKNLGQGCSRQRGIKAAIGEYIIHCDPDDWVSLDMYETLYFETQKSDADIAWCNFSLVKQDGDVVERLIPIACTLDEAIADLIHMKRLGSLWNTLVRKDIVQAEDIVWPNWRFSEDWTLLFQYMLKSNKMAQINKSMYFYRINSSSITQDSSRAIERVQSLAKSTQIAYKLLKSTNKNYLLKQLRDYQLEIKARIIPHCRNSKDAQAHYLGILPERTFWDLWRSGLYWKTKIHYSLFYLRLYSLIIK